MGYPLKWDDFNTGMVDYWVYHIRDGTRSDSDLFTTTSIVNMFAKTPLLRVLALSCKLVKNKCYKCD